MLSVAALYWVGGPRFGPAAAVMSALALAVFPSFVAVSRDNNLDALLILLMMLACGVGLRAIGSGRLLHAAGQRALVGLAFNTKTLAAYLVVPGLALGYLRVRARLARAPARHLLAPGWCCSLVSASWSLVVELTPASQRPFVGGSVNNTERDLTFGYNGFGRVEGQVGGPGQIPVVLQARLARAHRNRNAPARPRAPPRLADPPHLRTPHRRKHRNRPTVRASARASPNGRPSICATVGCATIAFGGPTGPLRLFEKSSAARPAGCCRSRSSA